MVTTGSKKRGKGMRFLLQESLVKATSNNNRHMRRDDLGEQQGRGSRRNVASLARRRGCICVCGGGGG
jgi:hypothetical protein